MFDLFVGPVSAFALLTSKEPFLFRYASSAGASGFKPSSTTAAFSLISASDSNFTFLPFEAFRGERSASVSTGSFFESL